MSRSFLFFRWNDTDIVLRDLAGCREPYRFRLARDALEHAAELSQPERLANDEAVDGDTKRQWLLVRLSQHFIELINRHVGKRRRRAVVQDDHWHVIDFVRIRNAEQRAAARLHPNRLVVLRPADPRSVRSDARLATSSRRAVCLRAFLSPR